MEGHEIAVLIVAYLAIFGAITLVVLFILGIIRIGKWVSRVNHSIVYLKKSEDYHYKKLEEHTSDIINLKCMKIPNLEDEVDKLNKMLYEPPNCDECLLNLLERSKNEKDKKKKK